MGFSLFGSIVRFPDSVYKGQIHGFWTQEMVVINDAYLAENSTMSMAEWQAKLTAAKVRAAASTPGYVPLPEIEGNITLLQASDDPAGGNLQNDCVAYKDGKFVLGKKDGGVPVIKNRTTKEMLVNIDGEWVVLKGNCNEDGLEISAKCLEDLIKSCCSRGLSIPDCLRAIAKKGCVNPDLADGKPPPDFPPKPPDAFVSDEMWVNLVKTFGFDEAKAMSTPSPITPFSASLSDDGRSIIIEDVTSTGRRRVAVIEVSDVMRRCPGQTLRQKILDRVMNQIEDRLFGNDNDVISPNPENLTPEQNLALQDLNRLYEEADETVEAALEVLRKLGKGKPSLESLDVVDSFACKLPLTYPKIACGELRIVNSYGKLLAAFNLSQLGMSKTIDTQKLVKMLMSKGFSSQESMRLASYAHKKMIFDMEKLVKFCPRPSPTTGRLSAPVCPGSPFDALNNVRVSRGGPRFSRRWFAPTKPTGAPGAGIFMIAAIPLGIIGGYLEQKFVYDPYRRRITEGLTEHVKMPEEAAKFIAYYSSINPIKAALEGSLFRVGLVPDRNSWEKAWYDYGKVNNATIGGTIYFDRIEEHARSFVYKFCGGYNKDSDDCNLAWAFIAYFEWLKTGPDINHSDVEFYGGFLDINAFLAKSKEYADKYKIINAAKVKKKCYDMIDKHVKNLNHHISVYKNWIDKYYYKDTSKVYLYIKYIEELEQAIIDLNKFADSCPPDMDVKVVQKHMDNNVETFLNDWKDQFSGNPKFVQDYVARLERAVDYEITKLNRIKPSHPNLKCIIDKYKRHFNDVKLFLSMFKDKYNKNLSREQLEDLFDQYENVIYALNQKFFKEYKLEKTKLEFKDNPYFGGYDNIISIPPNFTRK
jgi:hypothetical protein